MPHIRLTKTINAQTGLVEGADFEWPRMALSAYEKQWGPRAEWMEYVSDDPTKKATRGRPKKGVVKEAVKRAAPKQQKIKKPIRTDDQIDEFPEVFDTSEETEEMVEV